MELSKQEMELTKQEMELFLPLRGFDEIFFFLIWSKGFKIDFSKQEMELSKQEMELFKQEMELFHPFPDLWSKKLILQNV